MTNELAENMVKEGCGLMQKGDFAGSLVLLEKALEADPDHLPANYFRAFCLGFMLRGKPAREQKKMKNEILLVSRRLIEITPEKSLAPDLDEHLFPRETLRFAYNCLAWYGMERARTRKDLEKALQNIDHCLSLRSPLDSEDSFLGYQDTKVRILLRLERSQEAYAIVRAVLERSPGFADFQDIAGSAGYRAWAGTG